MDYFLEQGLIQLVFVQTDLGCSDGDAALDVLVIRVLDQGRLAEAAQLLQIGLYDGGLELVVLMDAEAKQVVRIDVRHHFIEVLLESQGVVVSRDSKVRLLRIRDQALATCVL